MTHPEPIQPDQSLQFLVLGAGRGGTSLLAGLLDAHPNVEVGFEAHARDMLMGRRCDVSGIELFDARVEGFLEGCARNAAKSSAALWGNKITTEQLAGLEDHNRQPGVQPVDVLDRFFNGHLAQVPLIFVLRDGRAVVRSKLSRTSQPLHRACEKWCYSVDVYEFLLRHHPKRHLLRYEDLVENPIDTLRPICEFLNIPFHESMLNGTKSRKIPDMYRREEFDRSVLDLSDVPAEISERIQAELIRCGYA